MTKEERALVRKIEKLRERGKAVFAIREGQCDLFPYEPDKVYIEDQGKVRSLKKRGYLDTTSTILQTEISGNVMAHVVIGVTDLWRIEKRDEFIKRMIVYTCILTFLSVLAGILF